jgi:hypothetical protein
MRNHLLIYLVATLLVACAASNTPLIDTKERGLLSTKMVNLSSAVDTYFADLSTAPTDNDSVILQHATRHDPRLLAPEFNTYLLKVQYQQPYAVVLLCNKEGNQAIMEDAGCSARLDHQVTKVAPCEFTLHVNQGCKVDGADPL